MKINGRFVKVALTWFGFEFKSCDINLHVTPTESKKKASPMDKAQEVELFTDQKVGGSIPSSLSVIGV